MQIFHFICPRFQTMRVTDWSGFVDFVDRVRPARLDLRRLPYVKVQARLMQSGVAGCETFFKTFFTTCRPRLQITIGLESF